MPLPSFVTNERTVEVPWLLARLGTPARLLDVGHADADYAPELIAAASAVTFQDVRPFMPRHVAPGARYTQYVGATPWPAAWRRAFDVVTCISVLDHVGLDAYGQPADAEALPALLDELRRVIAPHGRLLLSVPVGQDCYTTHPGGGQRVFSRETLRQLLGAWQPAAAPALWRFDGSRYIAVNGWPDVAGAGYLEWRAEAVACLELTP